MTRLAAIFADPQRRNVALLALAQALFMSVQGMGIAATPLAAYALLGVGEKWLATVPIFLVHLAIMGTTIPASLLMGAIGRRAGFSLGALLGVACGRVGCVALYRQSFPLMCARPCCRACRQPSSGTSASPPPTPPRRPFAPRRSRW